MANLRLLFPNRIDGATLSGGNWSTSHPRDNLKDRRPGKVARSASTSALDTKFVMDLGRSARIAGVALVGHNLTTGATWRVEASEAADFGALTFDSGAAFAFPPIFHTLDLSWDAPNWWSGQPTDADLEGLPISSFLSVGADGVASRYWRISVADADNPDGYVAFGRPFIGPAWVPPFNCDFGAQLGFIDPSTEERSLSGTPYFDRRPVRRTATFGFGYLPEDSTFPSLFDLIRRAGTTGEIFFVPDQDDLLNLPRKCFLARMREPTTIEQATFNGLSAQFSLEELT